MPNKFVDSYTADMISQLAQDETGKRQYYRPVYSLHKWWARRPGALLRSIILRASNPDHPLFLKTHGALSQESHYFQSHHLENIVILDPFMGGGTTLAEANRLGAKVIGCDLNPVSFWVVRETLKPIDLRKLNSYFKQLEQTAGEKIKSLYGTTCIHCHARADSLYAFWVRYVKCLHCNEKVYLFKRTLLNEGLSRNKPASPSNPATVFCPKCFQLNDWVGEGDGTCESCGHIFDPQTETTYDQGYYTCANCKKNKVSLIHTLETGQRLQEKWIAIEYWCDSCKNRLYKSPDDVDLAKMRRVEDTIEACKGEMIFPKQKILEGDSSVRWRRHNYQHYYEVFNARQLLAFNYLIEGICEIPEAEYRNAFFTVFSNSLEYNNMMTPYNYPHRKLHHLFNYHAMPLTTTPVENAVWGVGQEGAGTFTNCYRRYVRAKEYCHKPFDKFKNDNSVHTVWAKSEKISATFVSSFEELKQTPRGALLLCRDSAHLPEIPDQSVDFVITDPPYFDSIHYSELSNFFYVWLNALIDHPYFKADHVPTEQEAIVNTGMNKGEREYTHLLLSVFRESERVLRDNGKLIFTFHHAQWRVWWTVLTAIVESGFRVAAYFPVMSEYKVNPHIRNKQALDMDLVLVCQKRGIAFEALSLSPEAVLRRALDDLPLETSHHSNHKLFLHFMGELLKTASSTQDSEEVDYNWFAEALAHFDDFLETVGPSEKGTAYQQGDKVHQLWLFESTVERPS